MFWNANATSWDHGPRWDQAHIQQLYGHPPKGHSVNVPDPSGYDINIMLKEKHGAWGGSAAPIELPVEDEVSYLMRVKDGANKGSVAICNEVTKRHVVDLEELGLLQWNHTVATGKELATIDVSQAQYDSIPDWNSAVTVPPVKVPAAKVDLPAIAKAVADEIAKRAVA
jgi:hypothetical protein